MNLGPEFWLEKITDDNLKQNASILFDLFDNHWKLLRDEYQKWLQNKTNITEYLNSCKNAVSEKDLEKTVNILKELTLEVEAYNIIIESFSQAINDFLSTDSKDIIDYINKWINLLCNYFNATRILIFIDELKRRNGHDNKKIILAIGTVNSITEKDREKDLKLFEDTKEEIEYIGGVSSCSDIYFAFPVLGCSFDLFCTLMKILNVSAIHCAGHGANDHMLFCEERISKVRFENEIKTITDFIFLNCCKSYEFVNGECINNCNCTIVYDGLITSSFGASDGSSFYLEILCDNYPLSEALFDLTNSKHIHNVPNVEEGHYLALHPNNKSYNQIQKL